MDIRRKFTSTDQSVCVTLAPCYNSKRWTRLGGRDHAEADWGSMLGYPPSYRRFVWHGRTKTRSHANSFVWGGAAGLRTSAGADTFNVWSAGGIYLNGSVHAASDKNLKEGFSFVSGREVLDKVVEMPISKWRFKSEDDDVKHIGPVAQDFMASFGYGSSDKHITSTDADGVALAAIQGLNQKLTQELDAKQTEIDKLEAELAKQREEDELRD